MERNYRTYQTPTLRKEEGISCSHIPWEMMRVFCHFAPGQHARCCSMSSAAGVDTINIGFLTPKTLYHKRLNPATACIQDFKNEIKGVDMEDIHRRSKLIHA
jgi:hypothetical protein